MREMLAILVEVKTNMGQDLTIKTAKSIVALHTVTIDMNAATIINQDLTGLKTIIVLIIMVVLRDPIGIIRTDMDVVKKVAQVVIGKIIDLAETMEIVRNMAVKAGMKIEEAILTIAVAVVMIIAVHMINAQTTDLVATMEIVRNMVVKAVDMIIMIADLANSMIEADMANNALCALAPLATIAINKTIVVVAEEIIIGIR